MIKKGNFQLFESIDEFADWLSKENITRRISTLQVHHTASPNYTTRKNQDYFACLEGMRNFHINTNGWTATGQNITTFEDGKIALSLDRDLNKTPAGIKGANESAICIENIGNFDKGGDSITQIQKDTIVKLYALLALKLSIPVDTDHIVYHAWYDESGKRLKDYTPGQSSKTCPGTNFFGTGNTIASANTSFIPMVRDEVLKIKNKKVEEILNTFSKYFDDVTKQYQAASIDSAKDKGFITGVDAKHFNPDGNVTRGDLAVIINRVVDYILKH
nr:N-acetylmuramoyl-L-alanine amidase [Mycobacterium sp. E3298]